MHASMNFQLGQMAPGPFPAGGCCGGSNPLQQILQLLMGLLTGLMGGAMLGGPGQGGCCFGTGNPGFGANPCGGGFGGAPWGGGGGCGCGPASNFLGQPYAGGYPGGGAHAGGGAGWNPGSFGNNSAPTADLGAMQGGTPFGRSLASDAARNANGPGGWCYKWVANALGRHGVNVHGGSAYMAADQLANNPKFREVRVPPNQLRSLPPGAVVVWNKGAGHPHGHISIALGDGREASDKIRNQITNYGTSVRVFLPVG